MTKDPDYYYQIKLTLASRPWVPETFRQDGTHVFLEDWNGFEDYNDALTMVQNINWEMFFKGREHDEVVIEIVRMVREHKEVVYKDSKKGERI